MYINSACEIQFLLSYEICKKVYLYFVLFRTLRISKRLELNFSQTEEAYVMSTFVPPFDLPHSSVSLQLIASSTEVVHFRALSFCFLD